MVYLKMSASLEEGAGEDKMMERTRLQLVSGVAPPTLQGWAFWVPLTAPESHREGSAIQRHPA